MTGGGITCGRLSLLGFVLTLGGVLAPALLGFAQVNKTGIDPQAIAARLKAEEAQTQAFVRDVTARAEALQTAGPGTEARETVRQGQSNARAARPGLIMPGRVGAPAGAGGVNLDAILGAAAQGEAEALKTQPRLLVFVSTTIPRESLAQIVRDAGRAGGLVVLRGFAGGTPSGLARALAATFAPADQTQALGIDPRLFRAFGVQAVPTFVVMGGALDLCQDLSCSDTSVPPHDRLSGNVTLAHALEVIAQGNGPAAQTAAAYQARLRKAGIP